MTSLLDMLRQNWQRIAVVVLVGLGGYALARGIYWHLYWRTVPVNIGLGLACLAGAWAVRPRPCACQRIGRKI